MRGEVKTVASNAISLYYGLHDSTPEDIKTSVGWLLQGSVFAYGEVNIKVFFCILQLVNLTSDFCCIYRPKPIAPRPHFNHL